MGIIKKGLVFFLLSVVCIPAFAIQEFSVPMCSRAPVIDGRMENGEWDMAIPLSRFRTWRSLKLPSARQKAWLCYDKESLFLAFRTWGEDPKQLVGKASDRDGQLWENDSLELFLSPEGPSGDTIHFIGNWAGSIFDQKNNNPKWDADWEYKTSKTGNGWIGELAIGFDRLGVEPLRPGQTWRANVCHDNAGPADSEPSSWAPVTGMFHDVEQQAVMRFAGRSAAAGVKGIEIDEGNKPVVILDVVNSSEEKQSLKAVLSFEGTPDEVWKTISCGAQSALSVSLRSFLQARPGLVGNIRVTTAEDQPVFVQDLLMEAWQPIQMSMYLYNPLDYLLLEVQGPVGYSGRLKYTLLDPAGGRVKSGSLSLKNGRGDVRVEIEDCEPGDYSLEAAAEFPAANARKEQSFAVAIAGTPEWKDTEVGLSDKPLPPFTPLRVRYDRVDCLLRTYEFEDRFLPSRILSSGENVLAKPVRLLVESDGKTADLAAIKPRITKKEDNRVEAEAKGEILGVDVSAGWWMEEDGFWWVTVRLRGDEKKSLDRLVLEIPVRREIAGYVHTTDLTWHPVSRALDETGFLSHFWPVVSIVNDDRGLSWYCESARGWKPASKEEALQVDMQEDAAVLRCELIGRPAAMKDEMVYSFGLQACPVKPIPEDWRKWRFVHGAKYKMDDKKDLPPGGLSYPAEGNLELESGTLEAWVKPSFDAGVKVEQPAKRGRHNQRFFALRESNEFIATLYWNIDDRDWRYTCRKEGAGYLMTSGRREPWPDQSWRHVALTWGDKVRIYDHGELTKELAVEGLACGRPVNFEDAELFFGTDSVRNPSRFIVRELRVSDRALKPEEMLLSPRAEKVTGSTLLYDNLDSVDADTKKTPSGGSFRDQAHVTEKGVALYGDSKTSPLEQLAEEGCKTMVYHQTWTDHYGAPYPSGHEQELASLIESFHHKDMKLLLYMGYGLGDLAPETAAYVDYWASHPIIRWVHPKNIPGQAFTRSCPGADLWRDFILDHITETLDKYDFDGFYYDGTIGFRPCSNMKHGCGYMDEEGVVQPAWPVLDTRRFSKRLYAICKQHRKTNLIDCHTSAIMHAFRAAWVDQFWNGEQFQNTQPGYHLPMDYFRSQCGGKQYGAPSMFLTIPGHPFTLRQSMSFTMLHDVLPRANSPLVFRVWEIQDEFDVHTARWLPYWDNKKYLQVVSDPAGRVWDEAGLASLYLHHGKRALVILSNVQYTPAEVTAHLHLPAMGFDDKTTAIDAETGEKIEMDRGAVSMNLGGYEYRLIWVE